MEATYDITVMILNSALLCRGNAKTVYAIEAALRAASTIIIQ